MPELILPTVLPIFPLTGSLLLPGNLLPLNVFEPRYRNLVADALAGERLIGMIQPLVPRQDNWVEVAQGSDDPEIYSVGCVGRIDECEPQQDGRYLILLRGVCRFRVRTELPIHREYRRVQADSSEFQSDLGELHLEVNPSRLMRALRAFGVAHDLEFDFDLLGSVPGILAAQRPLRGPSLPSCREAGAPRSRRPCRARGDAADPDGDGIEPISTDDFYAPPILN